MSSLVYVLLCLSLHASRARHLGIIDKETGKGIHLFGKVVENEKLHETLTPLSVSTSFFEGMQTQEKLIGKNDEKGVYESCGGANNTKQEDTKAPWKEKEKEDTKVVGLPGNIEIMASSSQEVLQEATKTRNWEKQSWRMLGSMPHDAEETVDSKGNQALEDIVVMDYAQPHRKPPIHNRKP